MGRRKPPPLLSPGKASAMVALGGTRADEPAAEPPLPAAHRLLQSVAGELVRNATNKAPSRVGGVRSPDAGAGQSRDDRARASVTNIAGRPATGAKLGAAPLVNLAT